MKKKIIIWSIVVIIVSNLPYVNKEVLNLVDSGRFRYSNADASFTRIDAFYVIKPGLVDKEFDEKLLETYLNPTDENKEIFRLYRINPLCFWRWRYYLLTSRHFKYKSWKEIEPNRAPKDPDNLFQWF